MINITDYSSYVLTAYLISNLSLIALGVLSAAKYFATKKQLKNEKW